MTQDETIINANESPVEQDDGPVVSHAVQRDIREALEAEDEPRLRALIADFHPADTAELIALTPSGLREGLMQLLGESFDPETLTYLDDELRGEVMELSRHRAFRRGHQRAGGG